jgi:hypothetical protein
MSLTTALSIVVSAAQQDIQAIGDFASDAEQMLASKQTLRPGESFTATERGELKAVSQALSEAIAGKTGTKIQIKASKRVQDFVLRVAVPIKQKSFLSEMALAYLIARQEAFVKDYIFQLLTHKRKMMISSATMTCEELAQHKSLRSLWSYIAQTEVDRLGYGGIDDVAQYFNKKLGIDLTCFSRWGELRESSFRRNLIIHNSGRVNELYRKKASRKTDMSRMSTDMAYVVSAVSNILGFTKYVHSSVCTKFRLRDLTTQSSGRPPAARVRAADFRR